MNSSRYTCVFMIVCFLEFTEVTTFSDYDYISQMRRGIWWIWFTPVRTVTMVTYIWMQEIPCNFSRQKMMIMRHVLSTQRGDLRDQA